MELPAEYTAYCSGDGPRAGALTVSPWAFELWPLDDVEEMNENYEVDEYAPGFLAFGSNGGDEMLAFDSEGRIVAIPFVPMDPEHAKTVAASWSEFVERMQDDESAE